MRGWNPAPQRGFVHNIIVVEGSQVGQLHRDRHVLDPLRFRLRAQIPAEQRQRRPHPFPARLGKIRGDRVHAQVTKMRGRVQLFFDDAEPLPHAGEQLFDSQVFHDSQS